MSTVQSINRKNLRVARENIGLDTKIATKKISTSKRDLVYEWENGESFPNWPQVSKLAKIYNIPELLFFSEKLIEKHKVIPDYRVGADAESDENVKKLINVVVTRQKWLEKNLKEDGWTKNSLQGSGKQLSSPKELAKFISKKLDVSAEDIKGISGRKNTLDYLIQKAEECGVFVGKTISYHRLEVEDMRGLFISNDYCPFIVLNRRDSLSAQIFSFIHELAHFFRKSDAISNSLDFRTSSRKVDPEEVFCNKVAAEFLLPETNFTNQFYDKVDIDSISEIYKVSKLFIFYRLKELGKIQRGVQDDLEREIEKETAENLRKKAEEDAKKDGGNYTNSMRDSNGDLFNRVVSNSYLENRIGHVEAANLLRFSPEMV
jgi:Zn-dependent peptidase ImmA (M78 family)